MKKLSFAAYLSLFLALFMALGTSAAFAQNGNARITGTVTDPTGAIVPNASVVATNTATGVKYPGKTNGTGQYLFPQLPIGTYSVTASADGFKTYTATGITLSIDQEYVASIKLTVGDKGQTLEVSTDTLQVNTTDMQLNNIVSSSQMEELPLIGRNFTNLELTLPGVQASSDRFGSFSVSGSQTQQSEFLINGADTNDIALNTLAFSPNLDAIDQFNLIDGPLNAEYDRNSGGIVSATIKQGNNHFHGEAFEFYRDTFLNTLSFFQKTLQTTGPYAGLWRGTVSPYHQNIYGGTIGGPIIKDKLFFFASYQGTHSRTPDSISTSVFSSAMLAGNFSAADNPATVGTAPTATQAWGNYLPNPIPSTITVPGCTTAGETWAQCAYAKGGVFPTSAFNTISTKLVSAYVPLPNSGTYGYVAPGTTATLANQYIGRIDYDISPKNQLTVLGIYSKQKTTDALPFTGASLPGFGDQSTLTFQQYTIDYVHQFNSSTVNDLGIHWTRFNYQAVEPQNTVTPASLGFSIFPQDAAAASVPTISVSGNTLGFTLGFSTNGPQPRIDQVYQLDDTVSKVLGHHTLKFGYDGRRFNVSNPFYADNSGAIGFGNTGQYSTGDGALDFLLGDTTSYAQGSGATIQADAFLNYMFAQDTWKLTNTFTLDYGLGYSIDTPLENHQYAGEGIGCIVPGESSTVFTGAPKGFVYPGDPGCTNTGQAKTRYSEFGPRIGFAWAPDLGKISGAPGKLSIRGGFGIYYDRTEEESALQTLETPPNGLTSLGAGDFGGTPQFANPFADINGGGAEANKFPYAFPKAGSVIPAATWANLEPLYVSTFGPSFRAPYAENFQLSVEREFPSKLVARLSYIGSLARHNQITYNGNPETAAGHAACHASASCNGANPVYREYQSYFYPQNTAYGAIDPNTGVTGFVGVGEVGSESSSSYNSFQASITKAPTHGLSFQLSYTYSHALDGGSSFENSGFGESSTRGFNQYPGGALLNYGDSQFDARNRLVFAPIYIVPQFHGQNWYSPLNLALSGWEVSAITTVAQGFPFDVSYAGSVTDSEWCDYYYFYACPDVPNQVAPITVIGNPRSRVEPSGSTSGSAYLSKLSFTNEALGTFGNTHRNPGHGPGINDTDMVLAKNFNLSADGVRRLQLRATSANVFNHTQFTNPSTTWSDTTLTNAHSNFGAISGTQSARLTQLAVKIYF